MTRLVVDCVVRRIGWSNDQTCQVFENLAGPCADWTNLGG